MPFSPTTLSVLSLAALVIALLALGVAMAAWRRSRVSSQRGAPAPRTARPSAGRPAASSRSASGRPASNRVAKSGDSSGTGVAAQLEALRADLGSALRHMAVVRYDAFGDMGGHLSWSMALLDDAGDGVVITSIHGRSDSRTYAKNIAGGTATTQLAPEEEEAIAYARR